MANGKKRVTVIVAKREGFNGVWGAGTHWIEGQHDGVELDDAQISNLVRRPGIVVLVGGKLAKPDGEAPASGNLVALTADEVAVVEKHRSERAAMAKAEGSAPNGPGYTLEKGDRDEAVRSAGGTAVAGSAQAPLRDADILRGETPGAAASGPDTGHVKPYEEKGKRK